jgi:hypothetical protein
MVSMSNDAGGFAPVDAPPSQEPRPSAYPSPVAPSGHPPPGHYSPPGYYPPPGYGQPGYPPPGYQAQAYYPPPGYGYPPPGYPAAAPQPLKPGIIPLRPLTLSDIYNGAVAYVRMNPKATLGITAIVIVAAQVLALVLQVGPLAALGELKPSNFSSFDSSSQPSDPALIGLSLSSLAGAITTGLAAIVLSGLLTVIVGRAVFGAKITVAEAWQRSRGRLLALFGVTALEALGAAVLVAVVVGVIVGIAVLGGGMAAALVGVVLALGLLVLLTYLGTMLSFAPTLIVLERLGIVAAIKRSFALVKNDFWRVFGIRFLGVLVASVISGAVSLPFSIVGEVLLFAKQSTGTVVVALILIAIGGAIGQIITAPFNAGVVVLLYTDRRIRAEAFDLVLQGGATTQQDSAVDATDRLWLTTRPG